MNMNETEQGSGHVLSVFLYRELQKRPSNEDHESFMGSQHPSPNVKTRCDFEPNFWPEIITSRDAESSCFKGSRTSCEVISLGIFWPNFGRKRPHHLMDASCRFHKHPSSSSLSLHCFIAFNRPESKPHSNTPFRDTGACTPRGSCNRMLLRRVLKRFFRSKCFLEEFLEGVCRGFQ